MKQIFLLEDGILTYLAFAATADGKKVHVVDSVYNIVSVIDTATSTVIATIPVGIFPYEITVTPDGKKVYVTNRKGKIVGFINRSTVSVIYTSTNTVTTTVPVDNNPFEVAVTPDGSKVYVTNADDNTISVLAPYH
jgi:YVTN family beta-propeller protein